MFHLDVIADLVPPLTWWLVLPALVWLMWRTEHKAHRIFVISLVLGIQVFFLFAQTKMVCYTLVLLPLYALAVGHALVSATELLPHGRSQHVALTLGLVLWAWFGLDIKRTQERHSIEGSATVDPRWRQQNIRAADELEKLYAFVSRSKKPVIFNVPRNHHLRFMFAHDVEAWAKPPKPEDVQRLKALGYTVFVLQDSLDATNFPPGTVLVPDSVVSISHDVRM